MAEKIIYKDEDTINIGEWPSGVYVIKANNGDIEIEKKVIIN